jgi:vacuolar-type H+-ATPase subunit H
MQYAEALREVKKAETEVRDLKADAQRRATQVLRDAERQANALLEKARAEADAGYTAALEAARKSADKEREKRMKAGETEAKAVLARASGPDFKAAVDTLLINFERHVSGK